MELIIFTGIPASGKTTFFTQMFCKTHKHLSLDVLKTRNRESRTLTEIILSKENLVVDNTNLTRESRAQYIALGREAGYRIIGYQFQTRTADAIQRNAQRDRRIPDVAIWTAAKRFEPLNYAEGFDEIHIRNA